MYSLFIGRYQPFHNGHKALIETVLKEGKAVCIAIRDTEQNKQNPYSMFKRMEMVEKALGGWIAKGKLRIISIPDITEVCHGRKVGWGIREIRLDEETEKISATKIRGGNE